MINYDSMRITTYLTICYVHFKKISLHSSPRLKPNGMSFSYAKIDFILNNNMFRKSYSRFVYVEDVSVCISFYTFVVEHQI